MDLQIAGKWALIGGASKGLGLGCAQALVAEGVHVVINARQASALYAAQAQLMDIAQSSGRMVKVVAVAADITTEQGREAIFTAQQGPGYAFDILVTNAGGPPTGRFQEWNREQWIQALDANMLTPIALIQAIIDGMAQRGFGRIVNITSSAVKAPIDVLGLSNGARSGLTGFIAGLARSSQAAQGVTINNLLPGKFDTDRLSTTLAATAAKQGTSIEAVRQLQQSCIPARRYGTPQEFGAICAFLCSQQAGYINGQNILADGGAFPGTF